MSKAISQDFYMNDFLSGADSMAEAEALYKIVLKVLEFGCMFLRKWRSNSDQLRNIFHNASSEAHYAI